MKSLGISTVQGMLVVVLASLVASSLAACGDTSSADTSDGDVLSVAVTADLYSGSENPSWALAPRETQKVTECLKSDRTGADSPEEGLKLGFRGFLVSGEALSSADIISMRVASDRVLVETSSHGWSESSCPGLFDSLVQSAPADVGNAIEEGSIP